MIHPHYTNARNFCEGLAAVVFSTKWGFIDVHDRYVITPLYKDCGDFSEAGKFVDGTAEVRIGNRWGQVNRGGEAHFSGRAELQ